MYYMFRCDGPIIDEQMLNKLKNTRIKRFLLLHCPGSVTYTVTPIRQHLSNTEVHNTSCLSLYW